MKVYLYCLVLISFWSCTNALYLHNGSSHHFGSRNNGLRYHSLTLNSNQTFNYTISGDIGVSTSEGNWEVYNRKLRLTSFDSYKNGYTVLNELENGKNSNSPEYSILITDPLGYPLSNATAYYGKDTFSTMTNGKIAFRKSKDSLFHVQFLGRDYYANLNLVQARNIQMKIMEFDSGKFFLDGETWKIGRNAVELPSKLKLYRTRK